MGWFKVCRKPRFWRSKLLGKLLFLQNAWNGRHTWIPEFSLKETTSGLLKKLIFVVFKRNLANVFPYSCHEFSNIYQHLALRQLTLRATWESPTKSQKLDLQAKSASSSGVFRPMEKAQRRSCEATGRSGRCENLEIRNGGFQSHGGTPLANQQFANWKINENHHLKER